MRIPLRRTEAVDVAHLPQQPHGPATTAIRAERLSGRARLILWLTPALFAGPVVLDLLLGGWQRVFFYFAADAFYYLTVARHYALQGFFTFDQEFPTNGFHPLWQVTLGLIYRVALGLSASEPVILTTVLLINVALIAAAVWLLGKWFIGVRGDLPVLFLILPVGIQALLIAPIYDRYNSLYSYANGMESPLVLLIYAAILWYLWRRPRCLRQWGPAVVLGFLLGLLSLARLDHVFFAAGLVTLLGAQAILTRDRQRAEAAVVIAGSCGLVLATYVSISLLTTGMALPVSGVIKSSFPLPDLSMLLDSANRVRSFLSYLVHLNFKFSFTFKELTYRHAQIVVPAVVAAVYAARYIGALRRGERQDAIQFGLLSTALGVLLLGAYNYFYVAMWNQGHWYFPVSVLFVSLVVIDVCSSARQGQGPGILAWLDMNRRHDRSATVVLILVAAAVVSFFGIVYRNDSYNRVYADFFDRSEAIRQHYAGQGVIPKLVEFDDGIIGYATGYPTMSGKGYTLDRQAADAKSRQELLVLAHERGFRRIASLFYTFLFDADKLDYGTPSETIKAQLGQAGFLTPKEVEPFRFWVDYISRDPLFVIIGMETRDR